MTDDDLEISARASNDRAVSYIREARLEEAEAILRGLLSSEYPTQAEFAARNLGELLRGLERYDEAVRVYRDLLGSRDERLVGCGIGLLSNYFKELGDLSAAESLCREYLGSTDRVGVTARTQLGYVSLLQGKTEEAETLFGEVVAFGKDDEIVAVGSLGGLGFAHIEDDGPRKASTYFERAAQLGNSETVALALQALTELQDE